MTARHGSPLRGFGSPARSPSFEGRFGRMFGLLPPARYGATDNDSLANLQTLGSRMSAEFESPKDGADDEESGIPALYTYFGQFIDHDITFDPASSLQKQNDPDALIDFRTPALDLDNVYGRGPDDQPYLYNSDDTFVLGTPIAGGGDANAKDLSRNQAAPARALLGDPRNDENTIISQLQGLFLRFHNRLRKDNPSLSFEDVQRRVRFHYQYVIANDFLPRIVSTNVLNKLKSGDHYDRLALRFFHPRHLPFMPVEFSAAAYRLGHSMVRPGYRLNDNVLLPIFPEPAQGLPEGLTGFRAMNPAWGIDWGRFIDIDVRKSGGSAADDERRLQFAYRIDTSLVNPLSMLPPSIAVDPPSLALRNLERGFRLGLPSGQAVARAMCLQPLHDEQILIGQAVDKPDAPLPSIASDPSLRAFANNCPLWTYILAEAIQNKESVTTPVAEKTLVNTPKLGPVGGRIVAEVLLGLLFGDRSSYFNAEPLFKPAGAANYTLKDFVNYALGK
jgi:hypothetical protein